MERIRKKALRATNDTQYSAQIHMLSINSDCKQTQTANQVRSSFYRRDAYMDTYRCRRRKEMQEDEYQRDCSDDCQVQSVALFLSNRGEFYRAHFCGRTVWTETTRSRENQYDSPSTRSRIESSAMKDLHQFNTCSQVQFIAECLCNVARKTYSWSRTKRQTAS